MRFPLVAELLGKVFSSFALMQKNQKIKTWILPLKMNPVH